MSDKETPNIEKGPVDSLESDHETPRSSSKEVDAAWQFLDSHRDNDTAVPADERYLAALRRKIDWHIVPLMFMCYTMQFLDKVILNVSFNYLPTQTTHPSNHQNDSLSTINPPVRSRDGHPKRPKPRTKRHLQSSDLVRGRTSHL